MNLAPMQQDVSKLYEAREHLQAIIDRKVEAELIDVTHDDAVAARDIIDSLRWLWDELEVNWDHESLAKHQADRPKAWLVTHSSAYDGADYVVQGVFTSERKAERWIAKAVLEPGVIRESLRIEVYNLDTKL